MKHFYKCVPLLLLPLFSIAQSKFKPGYVVDLKGDTLHGQVDYKEWDRNPKELTFRGNASPINFTTDNAAAFGITGLEYYQRFDVAISQDPIETGKLAMKADNSNTKGVVFLKIVAQGSHVNLYSYTDDIKTRFYILQTGDTQPQELNYHAYYNSDVSASVQYDNGYRTELTDIAQKYGSGNLKGQIAGASYNGASLTKIVKTINGTSSKTGAAVTATASATTEITDASLSGSRWFLGGGINFSTMKFTATGNTTADKSNVTNSSSVFPKITGGIDFLPNKTTQDIVIRIEGSLTGSTYSITASDPNGTPASTSSVKPSQYNVAVAPQLLYNIYNKEALKFFIGAGVAFNFSSYNDYKYITTYGGSFPDKVQDKYPAFSSFWMSFPIRAGIALNNKIEINVCFIPSASLTKDSADTGNVTSVQAGFNYLFGAK